MNVDNKNERPIEIADPFARRLIGKYLDHRRDDIDKLTQALADADFETIRITGHNLYGSGSAYGLDDISWLGASIEEAADEKNAAKIDGLINDLSNFLRKLKVC